MHASEKCHRISIYHEIQALVEHNSIEKKLFQNSEFARKTIDYDNDPNLSAITIGYYTTLKTTTTSYLVDEIDVVGNLGGGLGLTLGISIFTVLDFVLEWLIHRLI